MAIGTGEKPAILVIHNKYLQNGGEDAVVKAELATLRANNYPVFYKEYSNASFSSAYGILTLPFRLFFNFYSFFHTFYLVKKHKIATVHVHNIFYNASPSVFWGAKLAGARTAMTIHNYRLFCLNSLFFKNGAICMDCHSARSFKPGIAARCFKSSSVFSTAMAATTLLHRGIGTWQHKVDTFIVINPLMHQLLKDIHVPENKIVFKANYLLDGEGRDYTGREDFYLFVGRLDKEKGIHHLVAAFQKLKKKLYIAGDGNLASYVQENTSDTLIWLGRQSKEDVNQLMLRCRALIFPSLWIEGMPLTIIEAMRSGAVTIAGRSVNTEAMVRNGYNGYLYESGNIDALIEVINKFEALNTEKLNSISTSARNLFLEQYTDNQHIKTINTIYGKPC